MEAFFSALKRRQPKEIAVEALELLGHTEAAAELKGKTRLTDAAINSIIVLVQGEEITELDEQADLGTTGPTYAEEDVTEPMKTPEEVSIPDHDFKDIRKAIKKGKGKKALKLCKAAKEAGARGSVLKDLTRQAKEL